MMGSEFLQVAKTRTHNYVNTREVGFGADPITRARFAINGWNEWHADPIVSSRQVVGTGRQKNQIVGYGPRTVSYNVLTTYDQYSKLEAKIMTTDQLILQWGTTTTYDSEFEVLEQRYIVLNNITLTLVSEAVHIADERCRCSLTFQKASA